MALLPYQELLQPFPIAVLAWFAWSGLAWLGLDTRSRNLRKVGWKGPLSLISPNIPLGIGLLVPIDQVSCGFIKIIEDQDAAWRFHHLSELPLPMLRFPLGEEAFPYVQCELPKLLKVVVFVPC